MQGVVGGVKGESLAWLLSRRSTKGAPKPGEILKAGSEQRPKPMARKRPPQVWPSVRGSEGARERVGAGCDGGGGWPRSGQRPLPLCRPHPPPAWRYPRPKGLGCPQWDRPGGGRVGRGPRIPAHRVEGQFLGLEDTRREPKPWLLLGVLQESTLGTCAHGCPQMHPGEAWPTLLCPACPVQGRWAGPCSLLGG